MSRWERQALLVAQPIEAMESALESVEPFKALSETSVQL